MADSSLLGGRSAQGRVGLLLSWSSMATKQTSSSPLNALQRYPPMPGHIWRSSAPKHASACKRCGAVRLSPKRP